MGGFCADSRTILGFFFLGGYYVSIWVLGFAEIPASNVEMVKNAMLQLGPPIGMIFNALFRTSALDEKREENTAAAFMALSPTAPTTSPTPQEVKVVNPPNDPVNTTDTHTAEHKPGEPEWLR